MNFNSNHNSKVNSGSSHTAPHSKNAALRTRSDSPYQQRTSQKDNPTQQLIKQAVDFLIQQLEAGKSETLTAYLAAMARFHAYSFSNILSIVRARPDATHVAGIRTWNELGRFVKRGEKGIPILAPMIGHRRRQDEADQSSRTDGSAKPLPVLIGFRVVHVFDIQQTTGEDLPQFEQNITGDVASTGTDSSSFWHNRISPLNTTRTSRPLLASVTAERLSCCPDSPMRRLWSVWSTKRLMNFCIRPSGAP